MIRGLQVGFGSPIGAGLLADLRARGVQMIRIDCQSVSNESALRALITEVLGASLIPLCLIRAEQSLWVPRDLGVLDIELSNEPDLHGIPPLRYADEVNRVYALLDQRHHLWAGVISNLTPKALQWLQESVVYWPAGVSVSVHRYAPTGARPEQAHKGFAQRENEVAALRALIGARPWGVSECGYHRGVWTTGWWIFKRYHQWTQMQQCIFTEWEIDFFEAQGATFFVNYQINSGQTVQPIDQYGWRNFDGVWMPVADVYQAPISFSYHTRT
jgi:hypothetical protein